MSQIIPIAIEKFIPAKVEFNYKEIKEFIGKYLEKYDGYTVTRETLADDKKVAQELGRHAKDISSLRKEKKEELIQPVTAFEIKMNDLEIMLKDAQHKISSQVKAFEKETLDKTREKIRQAAIEIWEANNVSIENRLAEFDDLVLLGATTAIGNLTSKTTSAINERIGLDIAREQRTELRLAKLETESYKNGLKTPLQRAHIEPFIYAEDDVYNQRLEAIIKAELGRLEAEQARAEQDRIRAEQADAEKAAAEQAKAEQTPKAEKEATPTPPPVKEQAPAPAGKRAVRIACYFSTVAGVQVPDEAIIAALNKKMTEAGFTTLEKIEIIG